MKKLIPLLLFFVAMPSWAARQFDIEVIIFKRAVDAEQTTESWPNTLPNIDMTNVGSFSDSNYRSRKGAWMLPHSSYRLTNQAQKLRNHAGFQVLMHKAWRQGDRGRLSAPVFRITGGKDYSAQFNRDGSQKGSANESVIDGVTEQSIPGPLYELDGKFQVYVEHYLYADVELDIKAPSVREVTLEDREINISDIDNASNTVQSGFMTEITPTVHTEEFLKSYRMDQKRRMRSSETHFLDHPLMGMIIQVRRVN
ncbi:peptidoglycan binding protein CsiV [Vibrio intestinalis]|uniref:peptidoglycan binding protein CsiV n=1 Tax=Vibrio intestinalis TaxID=2933291 RepID=UPI0021A8F039|nr:peptidoglycan binding protein CsiV [Vibrio intestinalis]